MSTYQLPELPYSYDALEPYLDEQTMRLHHAESPTSSRVSEAEVRQYRSSRTSRPSPGFPGPGW